MLGATMTCERFLGSTIGGRALVPFRLGKGARPCAPGHATHSR